MKTPRRSAATVLAIALLTSTLPAQPARATSEGTYLVYGVLTAALVSFGILAYERDYGKDNKPLEVPDQTGRDRKTSQTHLELVPPPESADETRPNEFGAGLALAARF